MESIFEDQKPLEGFGKALPDGTFGSGLDAPVADHLHLLDLRLAYG